MTAHTQITAAKTDAEHAYSPTCNCDACFATWQTLPPPTEEEQEQMARAFSRAVAPSLGGELLTDWPKVSFPDLDDWSKREASHRAFNRQSGGRL